MELINFVYVLKDVLSIFSKLYTTQDFSTLFLISTYIIDYLRRVVV